MSRCKCGRSGCRRGRPRCYRNRAKNPKWVICNCGLYHYPHRAGGGLCNPRNLESQLREAARAVAFWARRALGRAA
jgi:hypothetical protein